MQNRKGISNHAISSSSSSSWSHHPNEALLQQQHTSSTHKDILLHETECVLTDLNNIIDSHDSKSSATAKQSTKKSKQTINSIFMTNDVNSNININSNTIKFKSTTNDSTNLKSNSTMSTSTNGLNSIKKIKSKSFLLSLNRKVLDSPSNNSITFDTISYNSSKAVNTNNQNTISVSKNKKSSLNLMSTSVTSSSNISSEQPHQQELVVTSSLTSTGLLSSSTKKKRSSLFNLFSFSNSSNHTNKTNSNSSTTSLNKQQTIVNKSSQNVNTTSNIKIDYEDDVFVKKELEQQTNNTKDTNNNTNKITLTKRPLSSSTMEPIFNTINYSSATLSTQQMSSSSSSSTSSSTSSRFRPHSIAFPSNYQTIHRMSSSTSRATANATKPVSAVYKQSNLVSKHHIQLVDQEQDDNNDDLVKEASKPQKKTVIQLFKRPSIQSRGFSIPLNASFCLNTNPLLKYSNSDLNNSNPRATSIRTTSSLCLYSPVTAADLNNNNSISNSNNHISKTLDLKLLNQKKSVDLEEDLFNDDDFDDSILFKPDSFDIDTEGSCLKELNQRFKLNNETGNSDSIVNINSIKNSTDHFELSDSFKQNIATNGDTRKTNASCLSNNQSQKEQSSLTNNNETNLKQKSSLIKRNMSNRDSSGFFYPNYDNNNENLNGSATSPQMNRKIIRNQKELDMNEYFNTTKQDDEKEDEDSIHEDEETVQSICINNHHQTLHRSDSIQHQQQQTGNEEECTSNSQLIKNNNNNYKNKKFQQTKSLVNIDSQFKKSLELTNSISSTQKSSSVSNEKEKLMSASNLTNRPLSEASPTLNQSPILLAFHSTYFNKTSIEMVQIKKGATLKDILKPVLDNHNLNIDSYIIYREDNNKTINTLDLEKSSEIYSGLRLFLKPNQKVEYESEIAKTNELNLKVNKFRKSSLQMPSIPTALTLNTNENNILSCNNSSIAIANSIIIPNITNKTNNNINNSSSNNWQSYFNTKINNSKEKFNSKQKRNSCIAVMSNEYNSGSSSQNSTVNTLPDSCGQVNSSFRDSICSFQSYLPSPENSPTEKYLSTNSRLLNKNGFRKMANLSSIFVNSYVRNKEQSRREQLDKLLETFLTELPKLPEELNVKQYEAQLLEIEPEWSKFVGEAYAQNLQVKLAKQQMAIWELLATECSHIKTTKIIIDVFLSCLISLKQNESTCELFNDIDVRKLFCNIIDVFNCNLNFWLKYLLPIVQAISSSTINKLIDPVSLINGFSDFKNLFSPYEEFILEKNNSLEYFKKKSDENEHFNRFISWAENHPQVGRLKIADFMMIPVQRLTKYELLLKKIQQFTEDETRRENMGAIIDCVYSLPNSINIKLKYLDQFNDISESIEKYECIMGPNDEINDILNAYKILDIKSPLPGCLPSTIRELVHQGPLKLKESSRSLDVYCFLFTDLLLITKQKQNKKYKIIKPPVSTNRIIVKELNQTDRSFVVISLNDYNVPDSVSMFVSIQAKKWIELIELAKKKYLDELNKAKQHNECMFNFKSEINSKKSQSSSTSVFAHLKPNSSKNNFSDEQKNQDLLIVNNKNEKQFRRDSSATITEQKSTGQENEDYEDEDSTVENKISTVTSLSSSKIANQQQQRQYQQNNVRLNSRLIDRKIQRRNMTDPLTTQLNFMDEKHSIIMNSIIKRNSLNSVTKTSSSNQVIASEKQQQQQLVQVNEQKYQQNQLICGDSTSTIMSTDSGVSENNHGFSDESFSKSPMLILSMQAAHITPIEEHPTVSQSPVSKQPQQQQQQQQPIKASSLKATNSVLSTTSTISTVSSSSSSSTSSSSNEPTNISYSSSFNSTSSSARLAKFDNNKSLLDQQLQNSNNNSKSKNQGFSSTCLKYAKHYDNEDKDAGDEDDVLEQHYHDDNEEEEEPEENDYVDLYELNSSLKYPRQHSTGDLEHSAYSNLYNDVLPLTSIRHNIRVKHRSNSTNDAQAHLNYYLSHKTNPYITQQQHNHHPHLHQKYDMNNNDTDLTTRYLDLINSTNMKSKYQQSAKLSSPSGVSIPKYNPVQQIKQHQPLRKTFSKQNSTSLVNESVRVNSSDLIVKNLNENSSSTDYDSSVLSGQMYQPNYSISGLDNNHRMILVKLLNTTMDATYVIESLKLKF